MSKINVKECFEQGLLKKIEPNLEFSEQSIKQAEHFLEEAEKLIEEEIIDMAFIALYSASFHAARAILFKDGVKERSHYCVSKYIEEKYAEKEIVTLKQSIILDALREKRNDIQYSLEPPEIEENLNQIYNEVEGLVERAKEIIEKSKNEATGKSNILDKKLTK